VEGIRRLLATSGSEKNESVSINSTATNVTLSAKGKISNNVSDSKSNDDKWLFYYNNITQIDLRTYKNKTLALQAYNLFAIGESSGSKIIYN
jgi:hypothetical protein